MQFAAPRRINAGVQRIAIVAILAIVASLTVAVFVTAKPAQAIGGKRAAILIPFGSGGKTWISGDGPDVHEHFINAWAEDLHAPNSTPVQARFQTSDGAITLKVANIQAVANCKKTPVASPPVIVSAGAIVYVDVSVDGVYAGQVLYEHLNNVQVSVNQAISPGTTLGYLNLWEQSTCWADTLVDGVVHTHIEAKKGCYRNLTAWTDYPPNTPVGLLSSAYSDTNKSVCDESDVTAVMSPPPVTGKYNDVSGDQKGDLAWYYSGTTDMQVLQSDGTTFNGGFSQKSAGIPTWGSLADVNGDGKADLVWYYQGLGIVQTLMSDGTNFNGASYNKTIAAPYWAATGDVDGDGKADLAWLYSNGDLQVLFSDGTSFNARTSDKTVGLPTWGALADVNGDGKADLVWYYQSLGIVQTLMSDGATFNGPSYSKTVGAPSWAGAGDVNGDGKADLAWYYAATTDMQVLLSDGTTFNGGFSQKSAGVPSWAALEDVNHDGKADLVWYYRSLGIIQVLDSNGTNFNGASYNKSVGDPFWAGGGNSPGALGSGYPLT